MARPASRGYGAMNQNINPGGMPPGTAMRMGTSQRMTTAMRQVNYNGVGMNTQVNISARPVTQQGMMGMRQKTAGPGRQVQDTNYWLGVIRTKIAALNKENGTLKEEIERFQKDSNAYGKYERTYELLIKEVRELEGTLADYNLAMDKSRQATDPNEIRHYHDMLKAKNDRETMEVDKLFMQKQERERALQMIAKEMEDFHSENERKVEQMAPEKAQAYKDLMKRVQGRSQQLDAMRYDHEQINHQIRQREAHMQDDRCRDEYHRLEKQYHRLRKEEERLQKEASTSQLDPEEARKMLLDQVMKDKNTIKMLDQNLKQMQSDNSDMSRSVRDLQQTIEERNSQQAPDSQKYEVLFQRDQEMTAFIAKFDETKAAELDTQRKSQDMIVALLEHTSRNMSRENAMPDKRAVREMRDDLTFKERQMDASQSTQARLEGELAKRNGELEKINQLDQKITAELTSLNQKMKTMKEEMIEFQNVGNLRTMADDTQENLQKFRDSYVKRRDSLRRTVSELSSAYERLKSENSRSEIANSLDELEQKMRHYEQNIFQMKEYVTQKEMSTDFRELKKKCGDLIEELNKKIIERQSRADTSAIQSMAAPY